MNDRDRRVRDEAYRIWEEKGRPHGDDHSHWHEAEKRVGAGGKPAKAAGKARTPLKGAAVDVAASSKPKPTPPARKPVVKGAANAAVKTPIKIVKPATAKTADKLAGAGAAKPSAKPATKPKR